MNPRHRSTSPQPLRKLTPDPARHYDDDWSAYKGVMAPFEHEDLVQHKDNRGNYVFATIRETAIADRLDQVFGAENWSDESVITSEAATIKLVLTYPSGKRVSRSGTYFFPVKRDREGTPFFDRSRGAIRAFVKAARKLGIGRYLDRGAVYDFAAAPPQFASTP